MLRAFGDHEEVIARLLAEGNTELTNAFVEAGNDYLHNISPDEDEAWNIMEGNFLGSTAIPRLQGKPALDQFIEPIPFSKALLERSCKSHVLVYVPESSINKMFEVFQKQRGDQTWLAQRQFANETGRAGWHLIRKNPVLGSEGKSFRRQEAMLDKSERCPSARVLVYLISVYHALYGNWLFMSTPVRTSSFNADGNRIVLATGTRGDIQFATDRSHTAFRITSETLPDV